MVNLDELRKKLENLESKNTGDGESVWMKIEEGDNIVRFLPGMDDKEFFAETKLHRVPNEDGGTDVFHCRKMHDQKCPLCEAYYGLWKKYNATGKQHDEIAEAAKQIKPRERYFMNVVERSTGEVKILSVGQIIFKKVLKIMTQVDPDTGEPDFGDICDVKEGHDFIINKVMEDGWPKYGDSNVRPKSTPAGKPKEINTYLDSRHDIYGLVKLEDYDEVRAAAMKMLPTLEVGRPAPEKTEETSGKTFESSLEV